MGHRGVLERGGTLMEQTLPVNKATWFYTLFIHNGLLIKSNTAVDMFKSYIDNLWLWSRVFPCG